MTLSEPQRLLYRVKEAAAMLAISPAGVYRLMASGQLETVRVGRTRRVPLSAIEALAAGKSPVQEQANAA